MLGLSFPFRFRHGSAETLDIASDAYVAQSIASIVRTRPGELWNRPDFGINDPTFDQFDPSLLYLAATNFFPNVSIENVEEVVDPDGSRRIVVDFKRT